MLTTSDRAVNPQMLFHVAEHLEEEMEARGWGIGDVAGRMGYTSQEEYGIDYLAFEMTLQIRSVDVIFTAELAGKLGAAFGLEPQFLINLDRSWRRGCLVLLLKQYRAELTAEVDAADTRQQDERFALHFASHAICSAADLLRRLEAQR